MAEITRSSLFLLFKDRNPKCTEANALAAVKSTYPGGDLKEKNPRHSLHKVQHRLRNPLKQELLHPMSFKSAVLQN